MFISSNLNTSKKIHQTNIDLNTNVLVVKYIHEDENVQNTYIHIYMYLARFHCDAPIL